MSCIFCNIIAKEQPADIVWEDDEVVVFKDIKPSAPVHLLVVPKVHVASIKDLQDEHKQVVAKLVYVARDVAEEHNCAGYKLIFNVGRAGGQIVDHLHLHLLCGWERDEHPTIADLDV